MQLELLFFWALLSVPSQQSIVSFKTWNWKQELIRKLWTGTSYWLCPHGLLKLCSYSTQNHLLRGVRIHSDLDPPTLINIHYRLSHKQIWWRNFLKCLSNWHKAQASTAVLVLAFSEVVVILGITWSNKWGLFIARIQKREKGQDPLSTSKAHRYMTPCLPVSLTYSFIHLVIYLLPYICFITWDFQVSSIFWPCSSPPTPISYHLVYLISYHLV